MHNNEATRIPGAPRPSIAGRWNLTPSHGYNLPMQTQRPAADTLAAFVDELGEIPCCVEPAVLAAKSRDDYWMSPILKAELDGLTAEIVVFPRSHQEAIRVVALRARHRFSLTARGAGTGTALRASGWAC